MGRWYSSEPQILSPPFLILIEDAEARKDVFMSEEESRSSSNHSQTVGDLSLGASPGQGAAERKQISVGSEELVDFVRSPSKP